MSTAEIINRCLTKGVKSLTTEENLLLDDLHGQITSDPDGFLESRGYTLTAGGGDVEVAKGDNTYCFRFSGDSKSGPYLLKAVKEDICIRVLKGEI